MKSDLEFMADGDPSTMTNKIGKAVLWALNHWKRGEVTEETIKKVEKVAARLEQAQIAEKRAKFAAANTYNSNLPEEWRTEK